MNCFLRRVSALSFVLAAFALVTAPAMAENWPQWRGPRNDGISTEKGIPVTWSKTENVVWKLPLPGPGGATPVVWGDRIFVTSVEGEDLVLMCADTNGQQLWKKSVGTGNKVVRGDEGNAASPSPCTDGQHVWSFMAQGSLACFDFSGQEVWKLNMQDRYGKFNIAFGMTSTPVLDGDRLYFQFMYTGGAYVVALDKVTGNEVWKHTRKSDAHDECEHSYASPVMYQDAKHKYLLSHGADYIIAHDLKDGHEIFRCGGLNSPAKYNPTLRLVASPVASPGLIVVPSAKNGPVLGLDPAAQGNITDSLQGHVWTRKENTPDVPSPLVVDGIVYLCRENGNLIALDAKTGEEFYQKATHRDRHRASPVYADGKIYLTARDGNVSVVKAGREFELLATNNLEESISASPAISGGRIYLRSFNSLWAIGAK